MPLRRERPRAGSQTRLAAPEAARLQNSVSAPQDRGPVCNDRIPPGKIRRALLKFSGTIRQLRATGLLADRRRGRHPTPLARLTVGPPQRRSGTISLMIDWSSCPVVERDPERVSGAWVFRGTRVPVAALFENLEDGASASQFVAWFPGVTLEQVRAVLEHAARSALAPV